VQRSFRGNQSLVSVTRSWESHGDHDD